jgi:predicted phage baseplate assembly protein
VRVAGVRWRQVRSFFAQGPQDQVFVVRHDDEQETTVIFGDGVRGARLPAGVDNVTASYRFGSGAAAPPAGAITQLARPVDGIRAVLSPVAAIPGRDPDSPTQLKTNAPRSMLLLKRAVSVADFEAVANQITGVVKAVAEFQWIPSALRAGVRVSYIGSVLSPVLEKALREVGDPDLVIKAEPAERFAAELKLQIVVAEGRDEKTVTRDVRRTLLDGLLAPVNAVIGGPLWLSRLFQAVHDVEGVVAVETGSIFVDDLHMFENFDDVNAVCSPVNGWFDFTGEGAVEVTTRGLPAKKGA